jgi:uncharacterized membrane protein
LLGLALPVAALRLRGARREHVSAILPAPLIVILLVAVGTILEDRRFMLAMPALISAALLAVFGASLGKTPMIERFARLQRPDLPPSHVAHCRQITWVWCGFFVVNGAAAAALAVAGPLAWWTLYTGLIAYVLMGILFLIEYILRKYRFREYGPGIHDRILAAIFPPSA